MEHIVLPFGDRHTLFSYAQGKLKLLTTLPIFTLAHRVEISSRFLVSFAACKSALIIQAWFKTGRVSLPKIIELPHGVTGECILLTNEHELFVGGKSDRPWLGKINLQDQFTSWIPLLSDKDLENANEKGIDAISLSFGLSGRPRLVAYDNLLLPLYAWIFDKTDHGWLKPKRVEIEPVYTYEHIVSAHATVDNIYLITNGINHGTSMQFLRKFDIDLNESELLFEETNTDFLENNSEISNTFERGEDWLQVVSANDDKVFVAAGNAGLGIYDPTKSKIKYIEQQGKAVRFLAQLDFGSTVAVAFEDTYEPQLYRWSIEVFTLDGISKFQQVPSKRH